MRWACVLMAPCLLALAPMSATRAEEGGLARLTVETTIPAAGSSMEFAFDAIWMVSEGKLLRVDPEGGIVEIEVPRDETELALSDVDRFRGIASGEGAIWLPDTVLSVIHKVDPATNAVTMSVPTDIFGSVGSIGVGEGSIWVVTFETRNRTLTRYDAETGVEQARIALPEAAEGVLAAEGSVWVTAASRPELYRIDPATNALAQTIALHGPTHLLAVGAGALWVAFDMEGIVQRIDPASGEVAATIETGAEDMESDGDIAVGGGFVWVITRNSTLARIDPASNIVSGLFSPPAGTVIGRRLRYGDGSLWVSGASIFKIATPD